MTERTPSQSAGAERMRRHRRRRKAGLRSVTIQVREREVEVLAKRGFLERKDMADTRAVRFAIHQLLEQTLRDLSRR